MGLRDAIARLRGSLPDRPRRVPVLVLEPHGGCNCRCVMCDIWRSGHDRRELSVDELAPHLEGMRRLGVRWVVLSGGEPLLHSDLWRLCGLLRGLDVRITLLSTGLLLARDAAEVARWCDEVIVSLDGPRDVHDAIRRVPGAFDRLAAGVAALRAAGPSLSVSARCVLQQRNFRHLEETICCARDLGLDRVSFLAADTASTAFNRPDGWAPERVAEVALDRAEVAAFAEVVERTVTARAGDFRDGFVAESPERLRALVRHFAAVVGDADHEPRRCNAPWVSAVVEADGAVRPCFFQPPIGHLGEGPLADVLVADRAVAFRRGLDVATDPVCRTCVCTLWFEPGAPLPPGGRRR